MATNKDCPTLSRMTLSRAPDTRGEPVNFLTCIVYTHTHTHHHHSCMCGGGGGEETRALFRSRWPRRCSLAVRGERPRVTVHQKRCADSSTVPHGTYRRFLQKNWGTRNSGAENDENLRCGGGGGGCACKRQTRKMKNGSWGFGWCVCVPKVANLHNRFII